MESGKHRISFKLMKGEGNNRMGHYFGLVRDGAACDKYLHGSTSTGHYFAAAWDKAYTGGGLFGNGNFGDDNAGEINEGQIVSMEADLDKGTLRFWVDGKPHGSGHRSGVTSRLRWAGGVYRKGNGVQIVPTPELQPWTQ
jgi:hypothetical protein